MISQDSLDCFVGLHRTEFAEDLTQEEAERSARTLLNLYSAVYQSPVDVVREAQITNAT